jgi:hypothetical protein
MKKLGIFLLLLTVAAAVFANGSRENAPEAVEPGFGRAAGELVTVSGTLDVTDSEVVLAADGAEYSLSASRVRILDLDAYDNLEVSVTGLLTDCVDCAQDYDGHVFVQSAIAGDEEIVFDMMGRWSDDFDKPGFGSDNNNRYAPMQDKGRMNNSRQMPAGRQAPGGSMAPGGRSMPGGAMQQDFNDWGRQAQPGFGGRGSI